MPATLVIGDTVYDVEYVGPGDCKPRWRADGERLIGGCKADVSTPEGWHSATWEDEKTGEDITLLRYLCPGCGQLWVWDGRTAIDIGSSMRARHYLRSRGV